MAANEEIKVLRVVKEFPGVRYERNGDISTITLDRPEHGNAIDDETFASIENAFLEAEQDIDVKVVILRAAGADFCVGDDLESVSPAGDRKLRASFEARRTRVRSWEGLAAFPRPVVAQVQGRCLGAGLHLTTICDLVVAGDDAVFGDRSIWQGQPAQNPLLLLMIGLKKSRELLLLGRHFNAAEAERLGLITRAVPGAELAAEAEKYARAIALAPADGLAFNKEALGAAFEARGIGGMWRQSISSGLSRDLAPSLVGPGEFDFWQVRRERGLAAALAERDRLVNEL